MEDLECQLNDARSVSDEETHLFFWANYIIIAILNAVQFSLTIYGRHKLDTDYQHDDYLYMNWDALKLCLAVACLTWVFLAYGIIRKFRDEWVNFLAVYKEWDQVVANGIIWVLQLSAAAAQTAFLNQYFYCKVECGQLNSGSLQRNTAYEVFAWLLWVAWTPQLVWSAWQSRRSVELQMTH